MMAGTSGLRMKVRRLYRGETTFGFIPGRRRFYVASGVILVICVLSMALRGFNLGIDFTGGTQFQLQSSNSSVTTNDVTQDFAKAGATVGSPAQEVGSGSNRSFILRTPTLDFDAQQAIEKKLPSELTVTGVSSFSSSWGSDISRKALQGLIVFLIVVSIYIAIRFEARMAIAAIVALLHDLILTAGVYSIIGFEVTPSTVVGLLTILGFSLYDTVVIFDKVAENTKDLTAGSRMTFSDATNMAVNQTLMRSINTSLISLLPVAGLLFIGAFLLGVGTIKDLALVMFVGLATGAYSSLFLAAPIVTDLTERQPAYRALAKRVAAKRAGDAARAGELAVAGARRSGAPAPAPRPGARPQPRSGTPRRGEPDQGNPGQGDPGQGNPGQVGPGQGTRSGGATAIGRSRAKSNANRAKPAQKRKR